MLCIAVIVCMYICTYIVKSQYTSNSCNMGARDLPDMYARGPQARGLRAYISGESRAPML